MDVADRVHQFLGSRAKGEIVRALAQRDEVTLGELQRSSGISKGALVNAARHLEAAGLVAVRVRNRTRVLRPHPGAGRLFRSIASLDRVVPVVPPDSVSGRRLTEEELSRVGRYLAQQPVAQALGERRWHPDELGEPAPASAWQGRGELE